jgi:CRISPR system Cascade subunit CasE
MFLSQLLLNIRSLDVRHDLRDPYEMHRTLWRGFPSLRRDGHGACLDRILFRVDTGDRYDTTTVLVQSDLEPDWSKLPVGYLRREAASKPLPLEFAQGQRLRFRLRANPTKRLREASVGPDGQPIDKKFAGKRVALQREEDQIGWLLRKAENGGFAIPGQWVEVDDPEIAGKKRQLPNFRVDALPEAPIRWGFRKVEPLGTCAAVRFEGVLLVTDPARFAATLADGVGAAKGFGFGLLSVAPA